MNIDRLIKTITNFVFIVLLSFQAKGQAGKYEADVKTLETIGQVYYEIVSGPIGQKRDFDRLRNLFHPSATLTYSYWSEDEQQHKLLLMDIEGYIDKLDYLDKKGFYEEELYVSNQTYGSITQSISTYKFWLEDQSAEGRGFTSYQYFFDGKRYWIKSMFWMMESETFPIPKEFLEGK